MATIEVLTIKAAQSLRGQSCRIYISGADAINYLSLLQTGQQCENSTSGNLGVVSSVDYYGNSFLVTPLMPDKDFSTGLGLVYADELIIVTT